MDQIRTFVRVMWTQRFWVLIVIATIIGSVCWNMASSDLDAEFKKRKSAIDGAFNTVSSIRNEPNHPNESVNAGDMQQAKQQKAFVLKVWRDLYEEQREKVLYWPKSIGEEFVSYMDTRKFGDSINSEMRGFYLNYIENRFEALQEIVKAQKSGRRGGARGGGYGGYGEGEEYGGSPMARGGQSPEEEDYLVVWADQDKLQQKLLFTTKPSSMQVWVTQEDLWVYETLLNVIANTNKARGATVPENTAVRAIVTLQVGSEAAVTATSPIYIPQAAEGGGGYGEGGYGEMGMGGYGEGGYGEGGYGEMRGGYGEMGGFGEEGYGGMMGGRGTGAVSDEALVANRYLDAEGNPDPGGSGTFGTVEFRQLPIRMKLMMDQKWIPRVLIECANAALPVEVKQVRVNPDQSQNGFAGNRSRSGARNRALRGMTPDPSLAEVDIRGVVYIYNEPNTEELTIPGDEEEGPGDDEVAVADDSF